MNSIRFNIRDKHTGEVRVVAAPNNHQQREVLRDTIRLHSSVKLKGK